MSDEYSFTEEQYQEAVKKVAKYQSVSVSMIQRMGHKYTTAARIVDRMEEEGIISPFEGSRPRKVFIPKPAPEPILRRAEVLSRDGFEEIEFMLLRRGNIFKLYEDDGELVGTFLAESDAYIIDDNGIAQIDCKDYATKTIKQGERFK